MFGYSHIFHFIRNHSLSRLHSPKNKFPSVPFVINAMIWFIFTQLTFLQQNVRQKRFLINCFLLFTKAQNDKLFMTIVAISHTFNIFYRKIDYYFFLHFCYNNDSRTHKHNLAQIVELLPMAKHVHVGRIDSF